MIETGFSLQDLEYYLLIVVRVSCFVFAAPFFGTNNVPRRVKVGFSVLLAFLLYQFVVPHLVLPYNTVIGYGILVLKEAIAGILLGFSGNLCLYLLQFAGSLIDMDVGLSMVNMMDPLTQQTMGFSGTLYQNALMLMLLASNMHHWILRAFIDSYELIPTGRIAFNMDHLVSSFVRFMGEYFSISFRIFLPVFGAMLILNVVLGVMAKAAPQMNMFTVGVQIKIMVGLGTLFVTVSLIPRLADFLFEEMKEMMRLFAGGMGSL